jgi:hypothetical protein
VAFFVVVGEAFFVAVVVAYVVAFFVVVGEAFFVAVVVAYVVAFFVVEKIEDFLFHVILTL